MPPNEEFSFEGFSLPTYTQVPDELFDVLAPRLTEAELRVLLYIIRRTFGFKKQADAISLSQMQKGITTRDGRVLDIGTGMSRKGIVKGCQGLIEKGIITVSKALSEDGDNEINIYALRFKEGGVVTQGNYRGEPSSGGVVTQGNYGSYPSTLGVVTLGNPQHTVLQHTEGQQSESYQHLHKNLSWREHLIYSAGIPPSFLELTEKLQTRLGQQMTEATYNAWVATLLITEVSDHEATIAVPSRAALEWLQNRFSKRFEEILGGLLERPVAAKFEAVELHNGAAGAPRADP